MQKDIFLVKIFPAGICQQVSWEFRHRCANFCCSLRIWFRNRKFSGVSQVCCFVSTLRMRSCFFSKYTVLCQSFRKKNAPDYPHTFRDCQKKGKFKLRNANVVLIQIRLCGCKRGPAARSVLLRQSQVLHANTCDHLDCEQESGSSLKILPGTTGRNKTSGLFNLCHLYVFCVVAGNCNCGVLVRDIH